MSASLASTLFARLKTSPDPEFERCAQIINLCQKGGATNFQISYSGLQDDDRLALGCGHGGGRLLESEQLGDALLCVAALTGAWRNPSRLDSFPDFQGSVLSLGTRIEAALSRAPREARNGVKELWDFADTLQEQGLAATCFASPGPPLVAGIVMPHGIYGYRKDKPFIARSLGGEYTAQDGNYAHLEVANTVTPEKLTQRLLKNTEAHIRENGGLAGSFPPPPEILSLPSFTVSGMSSVQPAL